jgi:hypothetical protein
VQNFPVVTVFKTINNLDDFKPNITEYLEMIKEKLDRWSDEEIAKVVSNTSLENATDNVDLMNLVRSDLSTVYGYYFSSPLFINETQEPTSPFLSCRISDWNWNRIGDCRDYAKTRLDFDYNRCYTISMPRTISQVT